jgi:hypothetical protein
MLTACAALAVSGCSKKEPAAKPIAAEPSPPPTTPPSFTAEHVRASLIEAKEVGPQVKQISPVADFLEDNRVPMCSLTGIKLPGQPRLAVRQFTNPAKGKGEIKYAQVVAYYGDRTAASNAYMMVQKKARSCPPKQHVPAKKIRNNFTLFPHDDTWKITEGTLGGWTHIRGSEKHVEPPSLTKYNVYHLTYDYNLRGNVFIASLYYERTEPKESGEPVAGRATGVLTKQLRKIG